MTEITIKTDNGEEFMAYMATPASGEKQSPVVIIIQEIFGVNGVMRGICDGLAYQGYIAVCPDLFWRQEPGVNITDQTEEEWQKAFALYEGFDEDKGVEDLITTLKHVRAHEGCNGNVGTLGFCLGGKLAYLMATRSDADCNVSYYGVGIENTLDEVSNIKKPLLMHVAEKDQFVPQDAQMTIMKSVTENENVEFYHYQDVDHAFARIGGEHYDEDAAREANYRTADFLARNLISDTDID